jgi:glycosyltransferase involved in cell wall biosynthesis
LRAEGAAALRARPDHEATREKLRKVTLFIKAFERKRCVERLLDSIDKYYGHFGHSLTILVADDSEVPAPPEFRSRNKVVFLPMEFDSGLSAGRNLMLDRTETEYFVLLDDDFVFSADTRIEEFVRILEENPEIDLVAGTVVDHGKGERRYSLAITLEDGILTRHHGENVGRANGLELYDVVLNFFIAKTDVVRRVRWRDQLKIVEHLAFFIDAKREGVVSAVHPAVKIDHVKFHTPYYRTFRNDRVKDFSTLFFEMFGISEVRDVKPKRSG